ncbi:hypothetical protein AB0J20_01775 [Micromonospora costi]|uniref:hypothetical protein n=1 Tax=Micromonospora costi TaxID=1530042 RepID=UPI0033C1256F
MAEPFFNGSSALITGAVSIFAFSGEAAKSALLADRPRPAGGAARRAAARVEEGL